MRLPGARRPPVLSRGELANGPPKRAERSRPTRPNARPWRVGRPSRRQPSTPARPRRGSRPLDAPRKRMTTCTAAHRFDTTPYTVQPARMLSSKPLVIEGVPYFSAADAAREAGVSRQTLWRWRQEARVPAGRLYRDKQVLFTRAELESVCAYANRLVPLQPHPPHPPVEQLRLFRRKDTAL